MGHLVFHGKQSPEKGIIFPVSASISDHIEDYRQVSEAYSHPLLDFIEGEETNEHNVHVLNETIDYYRFYDLRIQAESLYDRVFDTIEKIIPAELSYVTQYDEFKKIIDDEFEIPDRLVALAVNFLGQNNGTLSKRAREREFSALTESEVTYSAFVLVV